MKLGRVPVRSGGDDVVVPLRIRKVNLDALLDGVCVADVWLISPGDDGTYTLLLGAARRVIPEPATGERLIYNARDYEVMEAP